MSKSSIGSDRIGAKPDRTARYYFGLVATLVSLAVGTHAATASTYSPSEATVQNGNLHAQTTTGKPQMGNNMGRTKKNGMSRSKMRKRMGRAKMNGMGRSNMNGMNRSTMRSNSSMRTGKN